MPRKSQAVAVREVVPVEESLGFRVNGLGFRVQDLGFRYKV